MNFLRITLYRCPVIAAGTVGNKNIGICYPQQIRTVVHTCIPLSFQLPQSSSEIRQNDTMTIVMHSNRQDAQNISRGRRNGLSSSLYATTQRKNHQIVKNIFPRDMVTELHDVVT